MSNFVMTDAGLSSGRAGAADLRESFTEFCEKMVAVGGDDYAIDRLARPGLPEAQILEAFATVGVHPADELVTYWTLSNGDLQGDGALPPTQLWYPRRLDEELGGYAERIRDADLDYGNPAWIDLESTFLARWKPDSYGGCHVRPHWMESWDDDDTSQQLASICVIFDVATEAMTRGLLVPSIFEGRPSWELTGERTDLLELGCGTRAFGW